MSPRFPVHEAFETNSPFNATQAAGVLAAPEGSVQAPALSDLPLELIFIITREMSMCDSLRLVQLNRSLRTRLLPQLNALAKQQLSPWALPTPAEKSGWEDLVSSASSTSSRVGGDVHAFPWWSYARACWQSPSMQNRRRIYGICLQLEAMARSHHVI